MNQPPPLPPASPALPEKKPRKWYVFAGLFMFYPVGLALLWFSKAFTPKAKKVWSLVWLPWFLFVLAQPKGEQTGQNSRQTATTTATEASVSEFAGSEQPPASYDSQPLEVEFTLGAKPQAAAIVLQGKTNLPDGTKLRVEARNLLCEFSANATVSAGAYEAGPMPAEGTLQAGPYSVMATTLPERDQPQTVRKRVGKDGENFAGTLIEKKEGLGQPWKRVKVSASLDVGDKEKGLKALVDARSALAQKVGKALDAAEGVHDRMKGLLTEIAAMPREEFQRERARLMGDARRIHNEAEAWNKKHGTFDAEDRLDTVDNHRVHGASWETSNIGSFLTMDTQKLVWAFKADGSFEIKDSDAIALENHQRERVALFAKSRQALADFLDPEKTVARMTGTDTPAQAKEKQERDAKRKEKWAKWEERRKQNPAPRPDATAKPYRVIDTELGQSLTTVWIYSDTASCWEEFALTVKQAAEDTFRANPSHPRVAASLMRTPSKDGGTIALQANAFFDSQATDASRWQIQAKRLVPNPKEQQIVKAWVEGWQSGLRRTEDLQKAASEKLGITAEDVDFPLEELEAYPVK